MKFCDECGSMMRAGEGNDVWECTSCDNVEGRDAEEDAAMTTTQGQVETEIVDVSDAEDQGLPTTRANCPKCDNDRAHFYLQQIRSADESETRFFICTECEHKWRDDDH